MIAASTPILLDTNIVVLLARGGIAAQRLEASYALGSRRLAPFVSVVTIGELLSFAGRNGWGGAKLAALEQLISHLVVVDISREPVLRAYARFDAELTRAGSRMGQQNDLWIAATAAQRVPSCSPPTVTSTCSIPRTSSGSGSIRKASARANGFGAFCWLPVLSF